MRSRFILSTAESDHESNLLFPILRKSKFKKGITSIDEQQAFVSAELSVMRKSLRSQTTDFNDL
jgi:hypothetical protein